MNAEMKDWLADHYDSEILAPEDLQVVIDWLVEGRADEALTLLTEYRERAWSDELDRRIKEADDFVDFLVDQYGVDRFGSEAAGRRAWIEHRRAA